MEGKSTCYENIGLDLRQFPIHNLASPHPENADKYDDKDLLNTDIHSWEVYAGGKLIINSNFCQH